MNLADLSKIDIKDLKNVNYAKLWQDVRKRPNIIISIVVVLGTLLIVINYFIKRQNDVRIMKSEILQMEEKLAAVEAYNTVKNELDGITNNKPKTLTGEALIEFITDLAGTRNIRIETFSPVQSQSQGLYDLITINLNITAKTYQDMWLFINDIEKSAYAVRIDSWQGQMREPGARSSRKSNQSYKTTSADLSMTVDLQIASVKLKNE